MSTLLISQSQIGSLMDLEDYIIAMERVHRQHGRGEVIAPGIVHADAEHGEYHIKTGGILGDNSYFGLKANGGFFQNTTQHGLPNILGIIYLSNAENGYPLAILDSVEISKNRTAAASAVAAKYLATEDANTLCVCGLGTQGRIQAEAISKVRHLKKIYAYGRSQSSMEDYAAEMSKKLNIEVTPVTNLAESVTESQIIVTCTPSREHFIKKDWIQAGTFIAAVGADSPGKHELEAELVASAKVVTDIHTQSIKVGELQHPISQGLMTEQDVYAELGKVITGEQQGRQSDADIIIYDSTGTALQDVAAASYIYEKLKDSDSVTAIDLFN